MITADNLYNQSKKANHDWLKTVVDFETIHTLIGKAVNKGEFYINFSTKFEKETVNKLISSFIIHMYNYQLYCTYDIPEPNIVEFYIGWSLRDQSKLNKLTINLEYQADYFKEKRRKKS